MTGKVSKNPELAERGQERKTGRLPGQQDDYDL